MNHRLRVLQDLGIQIERIAGVPATPARRQRRRLLPLVIAVTLLVFAAAALAASGFLSTGPVVRPGSGNLTHPASGFGAPTRGGISGILVQAQDPAGGPSWGMRVVRTTRGLACLQIGRVVGARLGVLGQDAAFNDDGRFHPLSAAVNSPMSCFAPDARGTIFNASVLNLFPARCYTARIALEHGVKSIQAPGGCANADFKGSGLPVCPAHDEREMFFGMLGPHALRLTYTTAGRLHTIAAGSGGSYLIVLPAAKGSGYFQTSLTPGGAGQPIRRIVYTTGAACDISGAANAPRCPAVGYVAAGLPSPQQVAAPLRVTHRIDQNGRRPGKPDDELSVQFTARIAVKSAESSYVLVLQRPTLGRCIAGGGTTASTSTDIAAGASVTLRLDGQRIGPCPGGTYTGTVYYAQNAGTGPSRAVRQQPELLPLGDVVPIGHFSFTEP